MCNTIQIKIFLAIFPLILSACVMHGGSLADDPYSPVARHRASTLAAHPEWSSDVRRAIATKQVVRGMTREQVMAAWGPPVSCSRPYGVVSDRTVCLYRDTRISYVLGRRYKDVEYNSVLFENGVAVDWQYH